MCKNQFISQLMLCAPLKIPANMGTYLSRNQCNIVPWKRERKNLYLVLYADQKSVYSLFCAHNSRRANKIKISLHMRCKHVSMWIAHHWHSDSLSVWVRNFIEKNETHRHIYKMPTTSIYLHCIHRIISER